MNYLEYYPYNNYFYTISEYCLNYGYSAVPLPLKHRDGRPQEEIEIIDNAAIDGLIVLEHNQASEVQFKSLQEQGYPVVYRVTSPHPGSVSGIHHVQVNMADAVCELVKKIIERGWHRLLLIVERSSERPNPYVNDYGLLPYEAQGIERAVKETGIDFSLDEHIIYSDHRWAISRYETVSRFLGTGHIGAGTCLLQCGADGSSGTYAALANAGLEIGVDIAVASTNATPPWEYVLPLTTSCAEYHEQSSRWLVENVIELVESKPRRQPQARIHTAPFKINMTDSTRGRS
jgi:DNA-binding LacI/PurR family transcriptional regulator